MSAHIHTYTYIHTRIQNVHMNARKARREAQLGAKKLCPSPCPLQSGGGYPSWPVPQSPVHEKRRISAEQPQPTAAHRTITSARRPDHIRLSALVWSHSTQFTQALSLAARPWPPETRSFFCHFGGFSCICIYVYLCIYRYGYEYTYVYIYIHIFKYIFVHKYVYLYIHICIYIQMYRFIHIHTYIYEYVFGNICLDICI